MMRPMFVAMLLMPFVACGEVHAQQIIAHRGHHSFAGAAQNSIAALVAAQQADIYASECDVNMTADGHLVVVHGPMFNGLNVQQTDFEMLRSMRLSNGESLPTLDEYLASASRDRDTRLIIEIKGHATPQAESDAVRLVLAAVERYQLAPSVDYISFSRHICDELVRHTSPHSSVSYLGGDLTPKRAKRAGYTGISYSLDVLMRHPRWIAKAHRRGLTVNVWTVNRVEDAAWATIMGVDYITTDNPDMVTSILH